MTRSADVVVVGGGAAGLLAAVACHESGLSVVCLEAGDRLGGATATGIGQLWLPATGPVAKLGGADSPDDAAAYLDAVLGPASGPIAPRRRSAFVAGASEVANWLAEHGIALTPVRGRVDLHPDAAGARKGGRTLTCAPIDARTLGPAADRLPQPPRRPRRSGRSPLALAGSAWSYVSDVVQPHRAPLVGGAALAGRLVKLALDAGVQLVTGAKVTRLIVTAGRVSGVEAQGPTGLMTWTATRGVILAAGGFEGNQALRDQHLPRPNSAAWTTGLASNDGAALQAATEIGAGVTSMHDAWWAIVARLDGQTLRVSAERSLPGSIIVDAVGDRFFNEAQANPGAALHLLARHRFAKAVPSYLIFDDRHRRHYRLGPWGPGKPIETPEVVRATSIPELASQLQVDAAGLIGTVVRFNGLAAKGKDADFARGESIVERAKGDPLVRKNPNLAALEKSPFWAVPVYPGDDGTKGGLTTDAAARVLDHAGGVIQGLYAVPGTAATLFPGTNPAAGASTASALVDALHAARHVTGAFSDPDRPLL